MEGLSAGSLGMRQTAQPVDQGSQLRPILLAHRQKFQSQSAARHGTLHHAIRPDGPIRYEKMKLGLDSRASGLLGLQEQSTPAQISNKRNIVSSVALPIDPHFPGRFDP